MLKLPKIYTRITMEQEREAKLQVGKFRARYYEKKKPTKNGYFVKDINIDQVLSMDKHKIQVAGIGKGNNLKNKEKEITIIKLKLKNEEAPYCLSLTFN